jgi:UDPglucose 6-dehydrogenase
MMTGQSEPSRIAVVGCGHVGAVTAACMAELGHDVHGFDVDGELIETLRKGSAPFFEPGLGDLLRTNIEGGRLRFTTSCADALAGAEFVFLCVSTPSMTTGAADLRFVRQATQQIAGILRTSGDRPLLVTKSTSSVGTHETIAAILRHTLPEPEKCPPLATNPEFLREGSAVPDFLHPERIVVGAENRRDAERVAALYGSTDAPCLLTDPRTAGMIKYAANAFLATRVSFVNEIAALCEVVRADVDTVIQGMALDSRIGGRYLNPGIGYGGSCLPKDVAALRHTGDAAGVTMRVLTAVQEANAHQRTHAARTIRRLLGTLEGRTIGVWGVTFKGGSEDLRESPALAVIALLRNEGAYVKVYDPSLAPCDHPSIADEVCLTALQAADGADCLAILSDWPEFAREDLARVRAAMSRNLIYDGRNLLRRDDVEGAGLVYHGIGRPAQLSAGTDVTMAEMAVSV